jgi:hypothetical protein
VRIEREEGVQWTKGNEGAKYEVKLEEGVKHEIVIRVKHCVEIRADYHTTPHHTTPQYSQLSPLTYS